MRAKSLPAIFGVRMMTGIKCLIPSKNVYVRNMSLKADCFSQPFKASKNRSNNRHNSLISLIIILCADFIFAVHCCIPLLPNVASSPRTVPLSPYRNALPIDTNNFNNRPQQNPLQNSGNNANGNLPQAGNGEEPPQQQQQQQPVVAAPKDPVVEALLRTPTEDEEKDVGEFRENSTSGIFRNETSMLNETIEVGENSSSVSGRLPTAPPNMTFEEWKVDKKMEKLLGIEQPSQFTTSEKAIISYQGNKAELLKDKPQHEELFFEEMPALPVFSPTWQLQIAPPAAWTFCNTTASCGSGDQAVDAENAFDNAQSDLLTSINSALVSLNLSPVAEQSVRLNYTAPNVSLEEVGRSYNEPRPKHGSPIRYRLTHLGAVRYRVRENGRKIDDFVVQASVTLASESPVLTGAMWTKFVDKVADVLTREKHVHFYAERPPKLISYRKSNNKLPSLWLSFM